MSVKIKFKKLREGAVIPKFATKGSACFDISALPRCQQVNIYPGMRYAMSTGLACEVPEDYEMQIRPRSGLAAKKGLTIVNSPGTVDSDYRGEIFVILLNTGKDMIKITRGDRIAQGAIRKVPEIKIVEVDELSVTERNDGGCGSTGD